VSRRERCRLRSTGESWICGDCRARQRRGRACDELNAAMREQSSRAQGPGLAREGLKRAEEGLIGLHCKYAVAHGQRGTIVEVRSSSMIGEQCRVTSADGRTGCYSILELKTSGS